MAMRVTLEKPIIGVDVAKNELVISYALRAEAKPSREQCGIAAPVAPTPFGQNQSGTVYNDGLSPFTPSCTTGCLPA
ncbi:hypothetical protein EIG75_13160 [Pseudomonas syringae]|uniref:Transposase n=1 Tax=Pseudomonas syringae TaxID=317 RepID=A0A6B2AXY9_PSESX|nr:hypothetical protein [Pseudomonas syringae]NAO44485.1 hypothetical protein [Pseudomonas syringae]NAO49598.1 hypothetical protein [Pseudomonas syringae]NAO62982.1 hypothetical protein [Pseudomonas syringae]NAO68205.1 hypothetical protein [Pseudomonas syringae]